MSAALATIANTTIDLTAADAFGGFLFLIVGIVSFLSISGLALSMTIGAAKSPSTMAITGIAGLLSVIIAVGLYMSLTTKHALLLADCPAGTWDRLGSIIAFAMGTVGLLSLGGLAVVMTIGAFTPNKSPVSSWPMAEEQSFSGFERRNASAQSQAWVFSVGAAVVTFLFAFGVYKGVTPDIKDITKDMNMSNLTKKSDKGDAPKADAPKADAPKADAPKGDAPKADAPKTSE